MTSPRPLQVPVSGNDFASGPAPQRPQQLVWGPASSQQQTGRRGLTPITTSSSSHPPRPNSSTQVARNPWSPISQPQSSIQFPTSRQGARSSSISSNSTPFSPPFSGQQTPSQYPSRTIAPSVNSQGASSGTAAFQGVGAAGTTGSGGGISRLSRASPSLSQNSFGSVGTSSFASRDSANSGQLSKIVIAQIFLLLSTIATEDKDKKWADKVDQLRKLVDAHGMDVFTKYFRRLLVSNAPQIWQGRSAENSGSYAILVTEVQKVMQDPEQAQKIVESVEFGEGEIFKDFDLSTFMDHFKLSPVGKIMLASAFKKATKQDLRTKADAIVSNNLNSLFTSLSSAITPVAATGNQDDLTPSSLAFIIDRLAQDPPRNWSSDLQRKLEVSIHNRYENAGMLVPAQINSTFLLFTLMAAGSHLISLLQRSGPGCTDSVDTCKNMLDLGAGRDLSSEQVAAALLFCVIARDVPEYDARILVAALRDHRLGQALDWQQVIHSFDRDGVKITKDQFKRLYDALLPIAQDKQDFDIQQLWGGNWQFQNTQLAFASAFVSFSQDELDASQIPRLRKAFILEDFEGMDDTSLEYVEAAVRHPLVSVDAAKALFDMIFRSSDTYHHAHDLGVIEHIINPKSELFVCSISAVPKPWGSLQDQAMKKLVGSILQDKSKAGREMVFHLLWKRDQVWLASRLEQIYQEDNIHLLDICDVAEKHGWLSALVNHNNLLSFDLATHAHGRGIFDLEPWLEQTALTISKPRLCAVLVKFLDQRITDDYESQKEKITPNLIPLTVMTVHTLLEFIEKQHCLPDHELVPLQRHCISTYPRLVNYGTGFDEIINANGRNGNGVSVEADARMQEHYKLMYSGESQVRDVIEVLQKLRTSETPADQDLFACMIFGLFDEYNCFSEYPLDALATTAVLFGSIINYDLLSRIALQAGLAMVLEAVQENAPEDSMYKFGLQALLHFQDRLEEWPLLTEKLLHVSALKGTAVYPIIEKIVSKGATDANGVSHDSDGHVDDFLAIDTQVEFNCLSVDPPTRPNFFTEPDESVQSELIFILNNSSEDKILNDTESLKQKLKDEHHQWFSQYLVDNRIRTQPNYHSLYLKLLEKLSDRSLWEEVLRETYVGIVRMLNSEGTMASSNERALLKNLGQWLGSLTLARDKPIKYRNISFRDLLIEAYDTQRLLVVIPFTCKVLSMASQSRVFRPPSAWIMEILRILMELYQFADLKLNLKFEIEVLCKVLNLDHNALEPSNTIRSRPTVEEDMLSGTLLDGLEGFNDLPAVGFNRRATVERFSPSTMMPDLSELASVLKHNYPLSTGSTVMHTRLRQVLALAAERAVSEIIAPVVERSVTIAAISSSQLMAKDFALEPDKERYQEAAHSTVKMLAGRLAQVTCREPLRASMTHIIRLMSNDLPESSVPENLIIVFVNDNIDMLCNVVERAAESASIIEIDALIEEALERRTGSTFNEPAPNPWSLYIPPPYRPTHGGLNRDQMAIYDDFGRSNGGASLHVKTSSQDSGRPVVDGFHDPFSPVGSVQTPADLAGRQAPPQDLQFMSNNHRGPSPGHINGHADHQALSERVMELTIELHKTAREAAEERPNTTLSLVGSVQAAFDRLRNLLTNTAMPIHRDSLLVLAVTEICNLLFIDDQRPSVVELLAQALAQLEGVADSARQFTQSWLAQFDESRFANVHVMVALCKAEIVDIQRIDYWYARLLSQRRMSILEPVSSLVDNLLLSDPPLSLRSDLSHCMLALAQWLADEPDSDQLQDLMARLNADAVSPRDAQADYIFEEWVRLQSLRSSTPSLPAFVLQLHDRLILKNNEDYTIFFWKCIDAAVISFEEEERSEMPSLDNAYLKVDALAKLIVSLIGYQAQVTGGVTMGKTQGFEAILQIVVLVLAQHYLTRGAAGFNAKVFFRLLSSTLCEMSALTRTHPSFHADLTLAFARCLKQLEPRTFPGFAFNWLTLVAHRLLIPVLLHGKMESGVELYLDLLEMHMSYIGEHLKADEILIPMKDLHRGTLKLLLVLHHDFPEFLAEHHYILLRSMPSHCIQMRSLVISAVPHPEFQLPDPLAGGLKVDRLEEMKRVPIINGDIEAPLRAARVLDVVRKLLRNGAIDDSAVNHIVRAACGPGRAEAGAQTASSQVDVELLNAVVLFCVYRPEVTSAMTFTSTSSEARLMDTLMQRLTPEGRYYFISGIVDQLRYPNSHTHYFGQAIFHFFRDGQTDSVSTEIKMQIIRVLLERLIAHRPHSWGLIMTLMELLKTRDYHFWDLPFIKDTAELEQMFTSLFRQMGQATRTT